MTLTLRVRRFTLTAHVATSVGWLGAVAAFLALAIAGLKSGDAMMGRSAYLAMELVGWAVIVPLCFAALLTGLVQSLCTEWGLIRHYWIAVKLVLTLFGTILLIVHMQPIGRIAGVAANTALFNNTLGGLKMQLVADAGAALLVLLVATTLSIYKPWGRTPYGERRFHERRLRAAAGSSGSAFASNPDALGTSASPVRWGLYVMLGVIALVLLFVTRHLASGGMGHH